MEQADRQALLTRARDGDSDALGKLLEEFRPYLRCVVRAHQDSRLRARLDESDLIQDALVDACRQWVEFRGTTIPELLAWLREIVLGVAANAARRHLGTARRDMAREQPLDGLPEPPGNSGSTPSALAVRHEQAARMAQALVRLPDDMQRVLLGRHVDCLPFAELAGELERSEGAARVLYVRALRRLRGECLGKEP